MKIIHLLVLAIVLPTLSYAQVALRCLPETVEILEIGTEFDFEVAVENVTNLHSLQFGVNLPQRVALVQGSGQAGQFLKSRGGNPVMLIDDTDQGFRVSLALLGTQHDVTGSGNVFRARLRIEDVPNVPRPVSLAAPVLKNSAGEDIPVAELEGNILATTRSPVLSLASVLVPAPGGGRQLNLSVTGHDLVDLHSYALDLTIDSNALVFGEANEGAFLASSGGQSVFITRNEPGKVHLASALLGVGNEPSGSGHLATVNFSVNSTALPTQVGIDVPGMRDSHGNDWSAVIIAESLTVLPDVDDSNGDGIPDAWYLEHFGSLDDPRARADLDVDGDGHNNLFEYLAGLDPNDAQSRFHVSIHQDEDEEGMWVAYGPEVPGRQYLVEWTTLEPGHGWHPLVPTTSELSESTRWLHDATAPERRFYRVRIQME